MSKNVTVSPEDVMKWINIAVSVGNVVVKITPTDVDNKILEAFTKFSKEPWFPELLALVVNLFDKKDLDFNLLMEQLRVKVPDLKVV